MVYTQANPSSLTEGRLLEGRKRLAYWCMSAILFPLFFLPYSLSLFFGFVTLILFHSFLSQCLLVWCNGDGGTMILSQWLLLLQSPLVVHGKDLLYTACRDWFLPFQPLTNFVQIKVSFLTTHWFVSCSATTTYLCQLCHSPLPNKEDCFVCLFTVAFLSTTVWVFSLAISHSIHLLVSIHHSFFWMVCHLSRTSPPKKSEWEPQNRLSFLPIAKPYTFLHLTHDPSPLYWLGTGWQCLGLMHSPLLCTSKACLLPMRLPWSGGSSVHSVAHP